MNAQKALFVNHQVSKRTQLIRDISDLQEEATTILEEYQQEILKLTALILWTAKDRIEEEEEEDDEDEYGEESRDYSTTGLLRNDRNRMSSIVKMLKNLPIPRHPYCPGCNETLGHPNPRQSTHTC